MRTVRCSGRRRMGGACLGGVCLGVSVWGCLLRGCLPGGCLPGGVCPGDVCPGVSAQQVSARGCLPGCVCVYPSMHWVGGVCPSACWDTPLAPPHGQHCQLCVPWENSNVFNCTWTEFWISIPCHCFFRCLKRLNQINFSEDILVFFKMKRFSFN